MARWLDLSVVWMVAAALQLTACGDDAVPAADGGSGTAGGTATAGDPTTSGATDGLDETADGTVGDPTGDEPVPCERNDDCDDGNACTDDECVAGFCEPGDAVVSLECRPQIDVDYPPRAATLQGDSPIVTVTGTVQSPAAPIAWLRLNGEEIAVDDDGSFSHDFPAQMGGNTLVLETVDDLDVYRKHVQSFLWSTGYHLPTTPIDGILEEGLGIYLDQETLDDQDRTPPIDDVASLLTVAMGSFDIAQFIDPTTPITSSAGYNVYLTDIAYTSTDVEVWAIDGGMHVQAYLYGITGDLTFDCTILACELAGGDGTGGLTVNWIEVGSDLMISVDGNHALTVDSVNTSTNVVGLDIYSNNPWTNFLITVIEPFIIGGVIADIESELTTQVDALLGPALSQAFDGLAPNTTLAFPNLADASQPIAVDLSTDFSSTDFHDGLTPPVPSPPQGGVIALRGGAWAQQMVAPYDNLGVPDRADCGTGPGLLSMPRDGLLELGMSDDLLNQLLHGAWRGGLLEFDMPPELLGGDGFVSDLQVRISGMLAPTASDCSPDGIIRAHLGDIRIDASLMLGPTPIEFVAYSSLIAGLEFTPSASGVAITITDVEQIDTQLDVTTDEAIESELLLVSILEMQLVDAIVSGLASGGLGGIDIPPIDLSGMLGLPPGTATLMVHTDEVVREPGLTVVRGHL